jgi:hypothetical protein
VTTATSSTVSPRPSRGQHHRPLTTRRRWIGPRVIGATDRGDSPARSRQSPLDACCIPTVREPETASMNPAVSLSSLVA